MKIYIVMCNDHMCQSVHIESVHFLYSSARKKIQKLNELAKIQADMNGNAVDESFFIREEKLVL